MTGRDLARRVGRLEASAAASGPVPEGEGARERLGRRLDTLAARMRASRGDGPLTPEEEAGASLATLVAWWPRISAAAEARARAFLAGVRGSAVP